MRTVGMSVISVVVLIAFTAASTFAWSECPPQPPPCKTSKHASCGSNVPSTTTTTTTTTTSSPAPPVAAVIPPVTAVTSSPAVVAPAPVPPSTPVASAPAPAPETAAVSEVAASAPAPGHVPGGNVCIYTLENDNLRVDVHHVVDVNGWIASHAGRANMPNDFVPAAGQMCGVTLASPVQARASAPLVAAPLPMSMPVQTPASPPESAAPSAPPNVEVQTPPVEEVQPPNENIPEALPNAGDGSLADDVVP